MTRQPAPSHWDGARSPLVSLARAFPCVVPVRVPVSVAGTEATGRAFSERTWLEFASPAEVLFASVLPLQLGDKLRVTRTDGAWEAQVSVVATRYQAGKTGVAAQVDSQAGDLTLKKPVG